MQNWLLKLIAVAAFIVAWQLMTPAAEVRPMSEPTISTNFSDVRNEARGKGPAHPSDKRAFHDQLRVDLRESARKTAIEGLSKPWSTFCSQEGQKRLVSAINYYFRERANQKSFYAQRGPDGEREWRELFRTADDNRIERLTREMYSRGYFQPDELPEPARATVTELVRDERVTGRPCG